MKISVALSVQISTYFPRKICNKTCKTTGGYPHNACGFHKDNLWITFPFYFYPFLSKIHPHLHVRFFFGSTSAF